MLHASFSFSSSSQPRWARLWRSLNAVVAGPLQNTNGGSESSSTLTCSEHWQHPSPERMAAMLGSQSAQMTWTLQCWHGSEHCISLCFARSRMLQLQLSSSSSGGSGRASPCSTHLDRGSA